MDQGHNWTNYLPWIGMTVAVGYGIYVTRRLKEETENSKKVLINPSIRRDCPEVVDTLFLEDLGQKASLCRCWRSTTFPLCDGIHKEFNKKCSDKVGPVNLKSKDYVKPKKDKKKRKKREETEEEEEEKEKE